VDTSLAGYPLQLFEFVDIYGETAGPNMVPVARHAQVLTVTGSCPKAANSITERDGCAVRLELLLGKNWWFARPAAADPSEPCESAPKTRPDTERPTEKFSRKPKSSAGTDTYADETWRCDGPDSETPRTSRIKRVARDQCR
jgi:hypothetical protein